MQEDLSVYSDTRFSHGMWWVRDNVNINWASEVVKVDQQGQSLYSLTACRPRNHRGDTLNAPTISLDVTTPAEGVIGVKAYHHFADIELNEPRFALNMSASAQQAKLAVDKTAQVASLQSGGIKAVLNTAPKSFGLDFVDPNGKLLTKLGIKSLGHVLDKRPHPDKYNFMTAQFHLSVQEKVYGLGERFGPLVKNGQRVEVWNEDGGTSSEQTYKNIPFYFTNRGYGVFIDSSSKVTLEVQSERTTRVNVAVPGEAIRFYIIYGPTPKDIIQRYTALTGRPALPPPWSFGLWLSTSFTTNYDIKTVSSFIEGMKTREIPLSTFHFDCFWMKEFQWCDFDFDTDNFSDPKKILKELKDKFGVRVCVWINSYIAQESRLFKEGYKKGYLLKKTNGRPYQSDLWQAGMGLVDFTNPDAVKWYQGELNRLIDLGVDSFKTDFGERIPVKNIAYHDGSDPALMHNYYTMLYNKCVFEVLEKRRGKNEACLFARSATSGGQQFPVHWGGDCESTFEAMSESLRGGLSLTLSGFGFWSHDIGGFEGSPDPAVYKRWVAFGLLSSHSRLHGSGSYRVPWAFDEESCDVLKKFTNLKLSLMPYLFSSAINAHTTGVSVMRAMLVEFPEDLSVWNVDTQFMLGSNLLVAPVFCAEGDVTYYVPEGEWYGLLDGKVRTGPKWFSEVHDYKSLPLLVKPNSIVVTGADDSKPEYAWNDGFTVNVHSVTSEVSASIPDHKKVGKSAATVIARPGSAKNSLEVTVEGSAGTWSVKVLNGKVSSVTGGNISGTDEFGNSIVKASGSKVNLEFAI